MSSDVQAASAIAASEPARILHALLDALEAVDTEGAAACFAADAVLELPYAPDGFPGYHVGQAAIAAFLQRFPTCYRRIR